MLTIQELIAILEKLPKDAQVLIDCRRIEAITPEPFDGTETPKINLNTF